MTTVMSAVERQYSLEQFYYREARLLDERQYKQWLELCAEDIHYFMPSRCNPQRQHKLRDTEDFLSVDQELQGVDVNSSPLREENILILAMRVDRAYKVNAWGENPPPSTRRLVHNVELVSNQDDELEVRSNFTLHFNRWGKPTCVYSGQR